MEDIGDLLKAKRPQEPPQIRALKEYALEHHDIAISVYATARSYMIKVPSGAIAHKFRLETAQIIETCNLDRKLVIHIG